MGRFINPFTDVGFKLIFGREVTKEECEKYDESIKVYRETILKATGLSAEELEKL